MTAPRIALPVGCEYPSRWAGVRIPAAWNRKRKAKTP